ncbi:hypothetical protein NE237_012803 [Protea cynaroides]|uniref:Uncharacterized protein n=1 Tax=Protea cynaroides TaxID=273540 RepID=A0A9Q0H0U1_9MAGN|nr:hypothetical protein NE237_012803 [Protea cynaroides]
MGRMAAPVVATIAPPYDLAPPMTIEALIVATLEAKPSKSPQALRASTKPSQALAEGLWAIHYQPVFRRPHEKNCPSWVAIQKIYSMGDPISIIYHHGDHIEVKNVDPNKYGYLDIVHDAYCSVLIDIPSRKTAYFSVKASLPNGVELSLKSDNDVMNMFIAYEEKSQPIQYYVFGVQVNEEVPREYTINDYPNSMMGRPNSTVMKSPVH